MNSYEKAKQLGLTGDDKTVFTALQTMGLTHRPINRAELVFHLNLLGMLQKIIGNNAAEKWRGTVLSMQDAVNAVGTVEQQQAMALWLSHITNPSNVQWDTTNPQYATGFWGMYTAFRDQPGMPTTENFAAIAALGGGWIATTEADYTAEREAAEKAEAESTAAASKQGALAEANDTAIHLIAGNPLTVTKDQLVAAFTTRLSETWPA